MWPQIAVGLFGGSFLGWLGHALYVRPSKGNRDLANIVNNVIDPAIGGAAQSALISVAQGQKVDGSAIGQAAGQQITAAALGAIQAALTGPHTQAPTPAPVVSRGVAQPAPKPAPVPIESDAAPTDATATGAIPPGN